MTMPQAMSSRQLLAQRRYMTVEFGEGPLGLDLAENDTKLGGVLVASVRKGGQGEAGGVVPMSVIVGLNGEDVKALSKVEIVQLLSGTPRPIEVKFKTPPGRFVEGTFRSTHTSLLNPGANGRTLRRLSASATATRCL